MPGKPVFTGFPRVWADLGSFPAHGRLKASGQILRHFTRKNGGFETDRSIHRSIENRGLACVYAVCRDLNQIKAWELAAL